MKQKFYVVICGTIFGPKTIHGIFEDKEHASQWISVYAGHQQCEVEEIQLCFLPHVQENEMTKTKVSNGNSL